MPGGSPWVYLTEEEREAHMDRVEKYWLSDADITIRDCRRRFGFPGEDKISEMLKKRGSHERKEKRVSVAELHKKLGGPQREFTEYYKKGQFNAKVKQHRSVYTPKDEYEDTID